MTFDTTRVTSGAYTPLEFAQEMLVAEQPNIPPYWVTQLKVCIHILKEKTNRRGSIEVKESSIEAKESSEARMSKRTTNG